MCVSRDLCNPHSFENKSCIPMYFHVLRDFFLHMLETRPPDWLRTIFPSFHFDRAQISGVWNQKHANELTWQKSGSLNDLPGILLIRGGLTWHRSVFNYFLILTFITFQVSIAKCFAILNMFSNSILSIA